MFGDIPTAPGALLLSTMRGSFGFSTRTRFAPPRAYCLSAWRCGSRRISALFRPSADIHGVSEKTWQWNQGPIKRGSAAAAEDRGGGGGVKTSAGREGGRIAHRRIEDARLSTFFSDRPAVAACALDGEPVADLRIQ